MCGGGGGQAESDHYGMLRVAHVPGTKHSIGVLSDLSQAPEVKNGHTNHIKKTKQTKQTKTK